MDVSIGHVLENLLRAVVQAVGLSFDCRVVLGVARRASVRTCAERDHLLRAEAEVLGIEPIRDDGTLKSVLRPWLGATKPKGAASTLESYRSIAENILIPYFGDQKLAEIRKRLPQTTAGERY